MPKKKNKRVIELTQDVVASVKQQPTERQRHATEEEDTAPKATEGGDFAPSYNEEDDDDDYSSGSSSDEDDNGQVVLEGVAALSDDDDDDLSSEEEEEEEVMKPPAKKKTKRPDSSSFSTATAAKGKQQQQQQKQSKAGHKKKKSSSLDDDIINVEFTFCDMDEKFFHGMKALLTSAHPLHATHSSGLADLMIENVSVGTVVSNEDGCVFGFASVLNVRTHHEAPCVRTLTRLCLAHCPADRRSELTTVLSGTTARPAGYLVHGRMINLPLEITDVLHRQLVLDLDWAVDHAEGGPEERKSLDFGALVLLAPCSVVVGGNGPVEYKYYDDEIFASHAEFTFAFDTPKGFATEDKQVTTVVILTKTGHRAALRELQRMIGGG